MPGNDRSELLEELRSVLAGRAGRILDTVLPLAVYLVVLALGSWFAQHLPALTGETAALAGAAAAALGLLIVRLLRRQSVVYALGGLGAVGLAAVLIQQGSSGAGFFLPGLVTGGLTVLLTVVSSALNRPLVAWTSHLARRWPLEWYWHPKVLPAYNEVTIAWGVVFSLRLWLEYSLYTRGEVQSLGFVRLFLGWPFTILLLIGSYVYGVRRLRKLGGPSVEEFKTGAEPPWESQRRGF